MSGEEDEISFTFQTELQSLQTRDKAAISRIQRAALPEGVRIVLRALSRGVMAARGHRWDEVDWAIKEAEKNEPVLLDYLDAASYEAFSVALRGLKDRLADKR